jgi:hypothetical protein
MSAIDNTDLCISAVGAAVLIGLLLGSMVAVAIIFIERRFRAKRNRFHENKERK